MKKILLVAVASLFVSKMLLAQDVKSEIIANKNLSASNYLAYPMPQNTKDTPAPKGYKPCYLSHYGRHGSRFLIDKNDYLKPPCTLLKSRCATPFDTKRLRSAREIEKDRVGES